jgi:molybdate transport system ATP-binding protein
MRDTLYVSIDKSSDYLIPFEPVSKRPIFRSPVDNTMQAENSPFITLNDVSLRLYDNILFTHSNWRILNHQNWAVVGPNGSGKSTLIKAIAGMVPMVTGTVSYHFGKQESTCNPPFDKIAYVAFDRQQNTFSRLKLFHQARFNSFINDAGLSVSAYLAKLSPAQKKTEHLEKSPPDHAYSFDTQAKILAHFDITHLQNRKIIQLSNGERRKVILAATMLKKPTLLILDNPFTGLDVETRQKLRQTIDHIVTTGTHVMISTCRSDDIPDCITHMLLVNQHCIINQGPVQNIHIKNQTKALLNGYSGKNHKTPVIKDQLASTKALFDTNESRPIIQMKDVSITYGNQAILKSIDWTVQQHQHWAVVGPNGAGKSTLLSLILGDNPQAYANNINLFGTPRGSGESIWDIKARIGWVAPELQLYYPKRTSCFNVVGSGFSNSIGLFSKLSNRQQKSVHFWMDIFDLTPLSTQAFGAISEGQQRLVLLARALIKVPPLLVLDEPCQGLDATHRRHFLKTIDTVGNKLATTIIFVTHRLDEIPKIIRHRLHLKNGRIFRITTQ